MSLPSTLVDDALLRAWPLPEADGTGDKEGRGHIMIVAGSRQVPGAACLAAMAALRVGVGKLVVAVPAGIVPLAAGALFEARLIALPENEMGDVLAAGVDAIADRMDVVDAVLVGPGWIACADSLAFVHAVMARAGADLPVVLDAAAMDAVPDRPRGGPVLITPHAGEMAHLLGVSKEEVTARPAEMALQAARDWDCVVVLKGATTYIASPGGDMWIHECVVPGLGMSGSGDVLAGAIAGLCARGASMAQAAVWGVALHARAGRALQDRIAPIGYLARELMAELPAVMQAAAKPA